LVGYIPRLMLSIVSGTIFLVFVTIINNIFFLFSMIIGIDLGTLYLWTMFLTPREIKSFPIRLAKSVLKVGWDSSLVTLWGLSFSKSVLIYRALFMCSGLQTENGTRCVIVCIHQIKDVIIATMCPYTFIINFRTNGPVDLLLVCPVVALFACEKEYFIIWFLSKLAKTAKG
jgi:hypothetical protein